MDWFLLEDLNSVILWSGEDLRLFTKGNLYRVFRFSSTEEYMGSVCGTLRHILFSTKFVSMMLCRYASLYFCMCIDQDDNELEVLEIIHHFVEILDRYFGSVSTNFFIHEILRCLC